MLLALIGIVSGLMLQRNLVAVLAIQSSLSNLTGNLKRLAA
jgi:hypothetical protein